MSSRDHRWGGAAILLGAALGATSRGVVQAAPRVPVTAQTVREQNERARELFTLGVNAFRAGRHEEARQLLSEALHLRRTYDVAAMLAQTEAALGHHARAAELLDFCLNNYAPIDSENKFQYLRQMFDQELGHVGILDLSAMAPGTDVLVDGEWVGVTPLGGPLYLEPGHHELVLKSKEQAAGRATRHAVVAKAGVHERFRLEAKPAPAAPSPASPSSADAAASGAQTHRNAATEFRRPQYPYYIGAGLFVVGATTAIWYQMAANDAAKAQDQTFNQDLAIFGYGIAATAAIATTIYWLWPEPHDTSAGLGSRGLNWSLDWAPSRLLIGASAPLP